MAINALNILHTPTDMANNILDYFSKLCSSSKHRKVNTKKNSEERLRSEHKTPAQHGQVTTLHFTLNNDKCSGKTAL